MKTDKKVRPATNASVLKLKFLMIHNSTSGGWWHHRIVKTQNFNCYIEVAAVTGPNYWTYLALQHATKGRHPKVNEEKERLCKKDILGQ